MLSKFKPSYPMISRQKQYFGTYDRVVMAIRSLLNRMSNEDNRGYAEKAEQYNKNAPVQDHSLPKNELQAEKMFQQGQISQSNYEKGRLQRIDDILGTNTHYHETKLYQQRLDSEHVINIQELAKKFKQPQRWKIDAVNPQLVSNTKIREKRKYYKAVKKLRTYPLPTQDISTFDQNGIDSESNSQLIKMLAQQALFTKLSLRELDLTIQSINNEKLLFETDDGVIEAQLDQPDYVFNGQVYFRPVYSLSMFRIDQKQFKKEMITSIDGMDQYLGKPNSSLQQLFNMDQIYQCLQEYYYDERVAAFLSKIENNQLEYFVSKMYLSPDSQHICIMIDLLGTKSEYVCMYKSLNPSFKNAFSQHNVLFNIKPQMAIRNTGVGYLIQRSQTGMYTQLIKVKFNQVTPKKTKNGKQVDKTSEQLVKQIEQQIIYTCLPHLQLQIVENKQAKTELGNGQYYVSNNIVIEQSDGLKNKLGNRLFVMQEGVEGLQQITSNGSNIINIIAKQVTEDVIKQNGSHQYFSECHEIVGVGYLVVRYQQWNHNDTSMMLKFGSNTRYGHFVTLIPYTNTQHHRERQLLTAQTNAIMSINEGIELKKQQDPLTLHNTFQINLTQHNIDFNPTSKLDISQQQLIYCCPQNQYFTKITVHTASPTNIYLLVNKSLHSVYDNHTLLIYPLRKNLTPYSIYLDGYSFALQDQSSNIGSGRSGIVNFKLKSPLLAVDFEYTLWKKQLKQKINQRIFTQVVSIPRIDQQNQQIADNIKMKIISSSKFIKNSEDNQPIILYLPSSPNTQLNQIVVRKLLQKGVIIAQPTSLRGTFTTDMINLLRGTKDNWIDCVNDIRSCIKFLKTTLSNRVSIYADGQVMCYLTLLLNIVENQDNSLFDCSVLHQGFYDLSKIPNHVEYFFGNETKNWNYLNPLKMKMIDPSKSKSEEQDRERKEKQEDVKIEIANLSNIMFTSLSKQGKHQGRKFICKLRNHQQIVYDTVFMKEFDAQKERDMYNLGYLYFTMKQNMEESWKKDRTDKMKILRQQGQSISRDQKDNRMRFK